MPQTSRLRRGWEWGGIIAPWWKRRGWPFGEGFVSTRRNAPLATSTSHTFGIPEREEKKTIFFSSGDQFGWKSPPCPVVSWRALESAGESSHRFISPARSELKATVLLSGYHAPRLSSRVVLTTASRDPLTRPACGRTGSFQMSAF